MTRDEFIAYYCEGSKISPEVMARHKAFLPCNCEESGCQGWAAVYRSRESIEHHMQFSMGGDKSLALEALESLEAK